MPFKIVRNDITRMQTDAIVNASNTALQMGGGSSGAIFKAAGHRSLQDACNKIGTCNVGEAVITDGYNLYAKHIIHTVGPRWDGGKQEEAKLLYNAYANSLKLALKNNLKSISFPLISAGTYGYPKKQAFEIALKAINDFLADFDMDIYLVVFEKEALLLSEEKFSKIKQFIDDKYVHENRRNMRGSSLHENILEEYSIEVNYSRMDSKKRSLKDLLIHQEETFSQMLMRLIDEKGLSVVETYKKANIDRRLFSKIRSNQDYTPSKITAISFAIALNLNLDETYDLLQRAGYALSPSSKFDIVIEFFIEEENYNIFEINEALFLLDLNLLGA